MFFPQAALSAIYKYVDDDGVIHFTDAPLRDSAEIVQRDKEEVVLSPASYRRIAEEAATKYSLDPELVKAVIKIESGWNPRAVSRRGAMGLMQLMPETVREMGVRNPYDPKENIEAGVRYLKRLINRFGDLRLALAAYNAGPTVVERYGSVPPYNETILYVRNILYQYNGDTGGLSTRGRQRARRIYKVVLKDGTILFTNSPLYLKGLPSF